MEDRLMINEKALHNVLVAMAEIQKSQYGLVLGAINELTSLREAVRGLDPTFAEVMESKRTQAAHKTSLPTNVMLAACDELIRRLKAGEVC
jgi:hypothetical protein